MRRVRSPEIRHVLQARPLTPMAATTLDHAVVIGGGGVAGATFTDIDGSPHRSKRLTGSGGPSAVTVP